MSLVKGVKYRVTGGDWVSGGEHNRVYGRMTKLYAWNVSILLTNGTPINLIQKEALALLLPPWLLGGWWGEPS